MKNFINKFINTFTYTPQKKYEFDIPENVQNISDSIQKNNSNFIQYTNVSNNLKRNLNYLKNVYHTEVCKDVIIRNFSLLAYNIEYKAFVIFIDGMVDAKSINDFTISPLMLRKKANEFDSNSKEYQNNNSSNPIIEKTKDITNHIYDSLIPQNSVNKITEFEDVFKAINMGNCVLFVESLSTAFDIDVKGFKQRSIDIPSNEIVVRGSQEAFVENLRTNTSMLRRLINNENLVLKSATVGKITQTQIAIGYINGIANQKLIDEVYNRISNLNIDYLTSSGQLEQLIQDNPQSLFPQMIATERPDKVTNFLLEGRVCVIVNGSPYVLVMPGVFVDFLSSPEDLNLKYQFANLQKVIRMLALFFSLLLPGIYIAITNFHQELLPTELLFTIAAARESVPFPTIIEILTMEISFELIREAGLRVPTPLGSTIGIVGALILGEAAVSASLVSPILIIVVAITGICSFSIPDFSLNFTFRICRFIYLILGYFAGFLGIGAGLFVQLVLLSNLKSFGSPYLTPFFVNPNKRSISSYFVPPAWKREKTSEFLHSEKKYSQGKISMLWRKNNQ